MDPDILATVIVRLAVPGIDLLRTCRQIHDEATAYLYCKSKCSFAAKPYHTTDDLIEDTVDWLSCIGCNTSFLPVVHVALTAAKTEDVSSVDVLPLVKLNSDAFDQCRAHIVFETRETDYQNISGRSQVKAI